MDNFFWGAWVLDLRIFSSFWTPLGHWDADDIVFLKCFDTPNIWTDGSREDFSSSGGFEVADAGVYLVVSEVASESSVWGTAEEYGDVRQERCRAFLTVFRLCRLFSVRSSGVLLLLCRLIGSVILALTSSMLLGLLGDCCPGTAWLNFAFG